MPRAYSVNWHLTKYVPVSGAPSALGGPVSAEIEGTEPCA
jgi:hypothetical protein